MRGTLTAVLVGLACVPAACRSNLAARHVETELTDVSAEGLTLVPVFQFRNDGRTPEIVRSCAYRLIVAGSEYIRGTTDEALRVPAGGTSRMSLPLRLDFAELAAAIPEARAGANVRYRVTVRPESRLWGVFPFLAEPEASCTGRLPIVARPALAVEAIRVLGIAERTVSLEVPVTVTNPNAFPITLRELTGRVEAARYALGEADWLGPKALLPGEAVTLPLRLSVSEVTWQGRLSEADRVPCELVGAGRFATGTGTFPWPVSWTGPVPIRRGEQ